MNNSERGSVLIYIFIAVALLGALYYSFSKQTESTSSISDQAASLAATEIIEYGQTVVDAVQKLQLRGCDYTEISFEGINTAISHVNGNSPSDNSCHVFYLNGGGINVTEPTDPMLDSFFAPQGFFGFYSINRNMGIEGVQPFNSGESSYSAHFILPYVNEQTCLYINRRLHDHDAIPISTGVVSLNTTFNGSVNPGLGYYSCFSNPVDSVNDCGTNVGCMQVSDFNGSGVTSTEPGYIFYQLIIAEAP